MIKIQYQEGNDLKTHTLHYEANHTQKQQINDFIHTLMGGLDSTPRPLDLSSLDEALDMAKNNKKNLGSDSHISNSSFNYGMEFIIGAIAKARKDLTQQDAHRWLRKSETPTPSFPSCENFKSTREVMEFIEGSYDFTPASKEWLLYIFKNMLLKSGYYNGDSPEPLSVQIKESMGKGGISRPQLDIWASMAEELESSRYVEDFDGGCLSERLSALCHSQDKVPGVIISDEVMSLIRDEVVQLETVATLKVFTREALDTLKSLEGESDPEITDMVCSLYDTLIAFDEAEKTDVLSVYYWRSYLIYKTLYEFHPLLKKLGKIPAHPDTPSRNVLHARMESHHQAYLEQCCKPEPTPLAPIHYADYRERRNPLSELIRNYQETPDFQDILKCWANIAEDMEKEITTYECTPGVSQFFFDHLPLLKENARSGGTHPESFYDEINNMTHLDRRVVYILCRVVDVVHAYHTGNNINGCLRSLTMDLEGP